MNGFCKKLGYVALVIACFAAALGSTGCAAPAHWHRPGWIIPNR